MMRVIATSLLVVLTLSYPAAVYFGLQYFDIKYLAALLIGLAVIRHFSSRSSVTSQKWLLPLILIIAAWSWVDNSPTGLQLYPVLINLSLLLVFYFSLSQPQTIIEKFARLQEPDLPPEAVVYTRKVTKVWCLFFLLNGSIALATVIIGDQQLWALYNGLISYILMGTLMAVEYLIRLQVQRRIERD